MKKKIFYTLVLASLLALVSCRDCVHGDGNIITEDRANDVSDFDQIELNGSFDLELIQDSEYKVVIEGDEAILRLISSRVSNHRLVVETKSNKCFSSNGSILLRISAKDISKIILSGSGNVYCDSLTTNNLEVRISGSGDIRLTKLLANHIDAVIAGSGNINLNGACDNSFLNIDGSGDIRAFNLVQKNCDLQINGSGNIFTSFFEKLTGTINGSGNVMYKTANGQVNININGSGSVRNEN